jgi:winged helix DNA-binding protein
MDTATALELRMRSLLLRGGASSVGGVVEWFGAMQAQDVNSGLWSLGVRLPGSKIEDITAALERREAIRTWPMRGTVHWVPPADARWMLELMGSRVLAAAERRRETLGLEAATADRAVELLGSALSGGRRLTRAECLLTLTDGGIEVTGQRGYHLLWYASQQGVTAIAPHVGKEQTFVLLDEWAPAPLTPDRDEALGIIALRYFRSHGPTTRKDFAGWTGLTMTDCKVGIAVAGDALTTVDVGGVEMLMVPADAPAADDRWLALPGFDEYLLGYKDRSMMATPEQLAAIIPGGNGVFQSTLVRGGRAMATWRRTIGRKGVTVAVRPLVKFTSRDRHNAEAALQSFADYLGLPLTVNNP